MRTSAAVAFCLLLGLVLLQAVSADLKLISVCPALDPEICKIVRPGKPECHNDGNCTGNMKCCCSNCGLRCIAPEKVKPGRCSNILAKCNAALINNTCKTDMDCQGNQKCCKFCGMKCRDPMPEPAGFCPVNDAKEVLDFPCPSSKCSRDSDCEPNEKCCPCKDGWKCVKPITVKPGKCPSIRPMCMPLHANTCVSDGECPGKLKCCNICGKPCTEPQPVIKPGTCPAAEPGKDCRYDTTDQCSNDEDCGGCKKCCSSSCGRECKEPAPKPGLCPVDKLFCPVIKDPNRDKCHHDCECPEAKKCCSGCGMQCMDPQKNKVPKIGMCPPFMPPGAVSHIVCIKQNTTECTYDSDCEGKKKCCSQYCNNVCRDPVIVPKIGMCPPFMPPGAVSHIVCTKQNTTECTCDSDCEGKKKCCSQYCNNVCRDPVIAKPGCCPNGRLSCPMLPAGKSFENLCQNDFNCTGDMKCCNRCGNRCTAPDTTVRRGSCPVNIYMCPLQTGPPKNECECDNQCPPNKKCCFRCGGKKCVDPEAGSTEEKAGMCPPAVAFGVALFKCPEVNTTICSQDSNCTGEKKCCYSMCRTYCAEPITAKPGCCPNGRLSCPMLPAGKSFENLCQNDFNCTGDMKCCNRCGNRCTAPDTTERNGRCPVNIYMCPIQTEPPKNECECDNQCPPNKKCCSRCGGKQCVDPEAGSTVIKPGKCPVVNTFAPCQRPLPQYCGTDSECDNEKKCCEYGCDVRCTTPDNE